jgi:FkbM family methyltransferase
MLNSLLWRLSRKKTGLSSWLRGTASTFLEYYNDFGYDFSTNGESRVLAAMAQHSIKTVFDVGANIGDWSRLAASSFAGATVHAFELSSNTRTKLKQNLPGPNFVICDAALGAAQGELEYKDYGDQHSTVNTIVDTTFHDKNIPFTRRTARIVTGDSYMERNGISTVDYLKIDVEGAEYHVLEGFKEALSYHRIRVIQFEYGYANGDAKHLMKDFYELLSRFDYQLGKIWTAGVRFSPFQYQMNNFDSGPNYLAVAKRELAIIEAVRSPV